MESKITITCNGGEASLGHPRVFLRIKDEGITCPYCGKKYDAAGHEIPQKALIRKKGNNKKTSTKKSKTEDNS